MHRETTYFNSALSGSRTNGNRNHVPTGPKGADNGIKITLLGLDDVIINCSEYCTTPEGVLDSDDTTVGVMT